MKFKRKLLIIGDYSMETQVSFVEKVFNRFNNNYDIIISGYNLGPIKNICSEWVKKLNSVVYNYYVEMADVVIISDMLIKYTRRNKRQKIFLVTDDVDENLNTIVDIKADYLVTNKRNSIAEISFDSLNVYSPTINNDELFTEKADVIIDWMSEKIHFLEESLCFPDILFLSLNKIDDVLYNNPEFQLFLSDIDSIGEYNLGLVSPFDFNKETIGFTQQYNFDGRLQKVLKEFKGVLVFENSQGKEFLMPWLEQIDNCDLFRNILLIDQLTLFPLYEESKDKISYLLKKREGFDENREYKLLLEQFYEKNKCEDVCISVIICRYNTELRLLLRAIDSVFESTHNNIELILVDDGSKDNIEDIINEKYISNGKNIKYYYKENEGIGLSRNYGIKRASGKYFFFLDSDDTVTSYGLKLLLAHAVHFSLNVVSGKRVLCSEDGDIISESLPKLMGKTYKVYGKDLPGDGINDCMVNNKLIDRDFVIRNNLRFENGIYEDVEYCSKLYSTVNRFHNANIHVHNWYQYDSIDTISSTITIKNFIERYEKTLIAWNNTQEHLKPNRICSVINSEMARYLFAFDKFTKEEQLTIWNNICTFILERSDYIDESKLSVSGKMIVEAAISKDFEYFSYVIYRFYKINNSDESYDNYIVFTHYHIITAISYTLKRKKPCRLFVCMGYNSFSRQFIKRLKNAGIFDDIIEFSIGLGVEELHKCLSERPNDAYVIIPSCLNIPYKNIFKMCNFNADTLFLVSDSLPYWYFVEKNFKNIIKLEDAYNSLPREVVNLKILEKWSCIEPYMGNIFPKSYFQSEKIKEIVVSKEVENIPVEIKKKVIVRDTKEIIHENEEKIKEILFELYDLDTEYLDRNTVMILTQPLAQYNYCTKKEQEKLYQKICRKYSHKKIVIKPHPTDKMKYSDLGVVMNKAIPIEVLNFTGIKIDKAVTFGLGAIETVEFANENIALFPLQGFEREDVIKAIKRLTEDGFSDRVLNFGRKLIRHFK